MGDLELSWDTGGAAADLWIESDDLASDGGLRTAVILSLLTDRRADFGDPLPGEDEDRRGWWGDQFSEVEGDRIGSRRWLLGRSKLSPDIIPVVESYDRESLSWMLDDFVIAGYDLDYEILGERLSTRVVFHREDGTSSELRFDHVWAAE